MAQNSGSAQPEEIGPYIIFYDWHPTSYEDLREYRNELAPEAKMVLDYMLESLGDHPYQIRIVSYTSEDRQRSLYEEVGRRRYEQARNYLISRGIDEDLITGEILIAESRVPMADGVREMQYRRSELILTPL